MLKLGKTDIKGYKSYVDYAKSLLDYCDENGVLYDWQEEFDEDLEADIEEQDMFEYVNNKHHKGLINKLMELVQLGFTQGSSPSMPKIKITEM